MHIDMKVALASAVLGFGFGTIGTLIFQPIVDKEKIAQEAISKHLQDEYKRRSERFVAIRRTAVVAIQSRTNEDIYAAITEALDLPFFRPRAGSEHNLSNTAINDASKSFTTALTAFQRSGDERLIASAERHLNIMTCWFDLSLRSLEMQMFAGDEDAREKFVSKNWDPDALGKSC